MKRTPEAAGGPVLYQEPFPIFEESRMYPSILREADELLVDGVRPFWMRGGVSKQTRVGRGPRDSRLRGNDVIGGE